MMTRTLPTTLLLFAFLAATPAMAQSTPDTPDKETEAPRLPDLPEEDEEDLDPRDMLPTPNTLRDMLRPAPGKLDGALNTTKPDTPLALPPRSLKVKKTADAPDPAKAADMVRDAITKLGALTPENTHQTSPLILHEKWPKVIALYHEGKCSDALKLTRKLFDKEPETMALPVQFAVAKLQKCSKREAAKGKRALRALAKEDGLIGRAAQRELGLTPIVASKKKETQAGATPSRAHQLKRARRLAKTDLDAALAITENLRQGQRTSNWLKLRRIEADWLWKAKRKEDAADVWRSVWSRTRSWKKGFDAIEGEIHKLERRHKVKILSPGDRIDRIRSLIVKKQYRQSQREERKVRKALKIKGSELKGWRLYLEGLEKERRRDRKKAAALFAKADPLLKRPELRVRLYVGWARALRRINRDKEAVALYDRICEEFPMERFCASATYQAGRLLQYLEDHEASRERFMRLVGTYPESKHMAEAVWRSAFSSYLLKDWDMADRLLVHLGEHYGHKKDESELRVGLKAQYWRGVVALKRGDLGSAQKHLQATIDRGPLTWYGRLAHTRLNSMGVTPDARTTPVLASTTAWDRLDLLHLPFDPALEHAVTLARLGFFKDALRATWLARKAVAHRGTVSRLTAHLHLAMGRADKAHWMMKRHIHPAKLSWSTLSDWKTAFPMAFAKYTLMFGEKYGVSPYLVQAIIRQESGFRPAAKSPVGALGLMQMMPRTARYTARVFLEEDRKWRRKELFTPETNVRLGSMYIRVHLAYAANHVALALAGYNAGPGALKRWFGKYGEREMDAWVESITYREARGYVRKVFTSYVVYSALYGQEMPNLTLEMPDKLGRWGVIKPDVTEVASR